MQRFLKICVKRSRHFICRKEVVVLVDQGMVVHLGFLGQKKRFKMAVLTPSVASSTQIDI